MMMKKIIIRNIIIVITFFAVFFILLLGATETSAQKSTCDGLNGKLVRTFDTHRADVLDWTFNGNVCDIPGDFIKNKTCTQPTGGRYLAYYCNPVYEFDGTPLPKGCEAQSPHSDDTAPAYCNRPDPGVITDISRIFGQIQPPQAIQNFGFGGLGISKFLSNTIALIYIIAIIVLIFMILWSAFEWLTSGGDKEKVESARRRLTYAFLGIILFAAAFAVIQIIGRFTGFNFFVGQKP